MKSLPSPSLSSSNKLFTEKKYFAAVSDLALFQDLVTGSVLSHRIQNVIDWKLSKLISVASRSSFQNKFKDDLLRSLERIQEDQLKLNFKKFDASKISSKESFRQVKVQQSRIEHCDYLSVVGWIACNETISESSGKPPQFMLKYGDASYYVNIPLLKRDDVSKQTNLPSYQYKIDFTPFFPPFRSICLNSLDAMPKKAKLIIKSASSDKVYDLDLKINDGHHNSEPLIFFTSHDLRNAGAQNSLLQMVERLSAFTNWNMMVASPSDGPMRKEYEGSKVSFLIDKDFGFNFDTPDVFISRLYSQILTLLRLDPSLIVANTFHTSLTILAASCLDIPTVLIPRESENPFDLFKKFSISIRKFFISTPLLADKCIFVSKYTRQNWIIGDANYLLEKYLVINNGLNISKLFAKTFNLTTSQAREMLGIPLDANVALTVGTVTERKGQFDTIKSFVDFIGATQKRNSYLLIIGLERNYYSSLINKFICSLPLDIQKYIKIFEATTSPSDNLCAIAYKSSDLFVMSSKLESYPRVVLEAISYGLGIVSTPCFGVKEMLKDNEAIFYECGNIDELSKIFTNIFSSPELINRLKNSSSQAFKRLETVESMTQKYHKVFQNLLSNG